MSSVKPDPMLRILEEPRDASQLECLTLDGLPDASTLTRALRVTSPTRRARVRVLASGKPSSVRHSSWLASRGSSRMRSIGSGLTDDICVLLLASQVHVRRYRRYPRSSFLQRLRRSNSFTANFRFALKRSPDQARAMTV